MVPSQLTALCTRIQAGYQVDELWGYSAEGQDSPGNISFTESNDLRFTIYDFRFTVYDNVMYGRVLMCETGLLMALVSFSGIQFDQNVRAHSGIRKQALISGFLYAGSPST